MSTSLGGGSSILDNGSVILAPHLKNDKAVVRREKEKATGHSKTKCCFFFNFSLSLLKKVSITLLVWFSHSALLVRSDLSTFSFPLFSIFFSFHPSTTTTTAAITPPQYNLSSLFSLVRSYNKICRYTLVSPHQKCNKLFMLPTKHLRWPVRV